MLAQVIPAWEFDMYIAGRTPKSELTYYNLSALCEKYLGSKCIINIIDLLKKPQIAVEKQIMAIPTIIRIKPEPQRILIGDLTNTEVVISKFDLKNYQLNLQGTMVSCKENQILSNVNRIRLVNYKLVF